MLKKLIFLIVALGITSGIALVAEAATPEEKKAELLLQTEQLVSQYGGTTDPVTLKKLYSEIEASWQNYVPVFGVSGDLARDLAFLRARAASAAKRKNVASKWNDAIRLLPIATTGAKRMTYFTQAANASAAVEDFQSANQFFSAARTFATVQGTKADQARLYMRLHQLKSTGKGMEWRRLRDNLLDMRKFSEAFVLWSIPRLDALIGEAEIRIVLQPQSDEEKRKVLGDLKAKIILAQKGMNDAVPAMQTERIRNLFYSLEDHYDL